MKLEEEMPRPAFVDLKLNRDLLDANFDGYKLSNDKFPTYVKELSITVDKVDLKDEISSQRLQIFTAHNFLHFDPWNKKSFYAVDSLWKIYRFTYQITDSDAGEQGSLFRFDRCFKVWNIPPIAQKAGRFNVTLKFLDQQSIVVADGCGTLYLIETTDRSMDSESWAIVKDFQFSEASSSPDPFVLLDAVQYESEGDVLIDTLIVRVRDKDTLNERDQPLTKALEFPDTPLLDKCSKISFVTTITWLTIKKGKISDAWEVSNIRSLVGTGPIRYGSIELDGKGTIIASDNQFEFYYVDGKPLRYSKPRSIIKGDEELQGSYLWKQTAEEVTIWLRIPFSTNKSDLNIQILPQKMCCALNNQILIEGDILYPIDQDKSRWTIGNSGADSTMESAMYKRLEIVLHKAESGKVWDNSSIFSGNPLSFGKEISHLDIAEIERELENLGTEKKESDMEKVYDGQQLEECDSCLSDTSSLIRIGKEDQCVTHIASLSSHQWFSSSNYGIQKPPPFCIRHDVDAIVWQPPSKLISNEAASVQSWKIEHIATFLAMGYVQASKADRRFTVFPEDFSYVALVDAQKHVYVYRQSVGVQTELRNRKTGAKVSHVAKQFVLSIDPPLDVLGSAAVEDFLFILTTKNIHAIRVQQTSSP